MKFMKRTIAILFALVLTFSIQVSVPASAAVSKDGKTYTVEVGDTLQKISEKLFGSSSKFMQIYNANRDVIKDADLIYPGQKLVIPSGNTAKTGEAFKLVETRAFSLVNAEIKVYEHIKTGAKVLFVENNDPDRCFSIAFKTPDIDNSGIPHVFEHVTLGGSDKYPSKSLWFNLIYQTYNTYLNASTVNTFTFFPCASLSEDQLLKYADYYTDSVFNPSVMSDETMFKREAWRYSLQSADDDIIIDGTVYNEMMGYNTPSEWAMVNNYRTLFPGSTIGNFNGGDPEYIPTMTWQALKDFHDAYYHPSNSMSVIYGKIEKEDEFLDLLDGYFSKYEKKNIVIEDKDYKPLTESVTKVYKAPMEADANVENGTIAYYSFECGKNFDNACELDVLTWLLNDSASILKQNAKERLGKASITCGFDDMGPRPYITFYCTGINEEDVETFRSIVDDSLAEIAEIGFDDETVDSIIATNKIDNMLTGDATGLGPDLAYYFYMNWVTYKDELSFVDYTEGTEKCREYYESGILMKLLKKYLTGDAISAMSVTVPTPGLSEQKAEELKAKLAEYKASLSDKEIKQLIKDTKKYAADIIDDSGDMVKQLTAVTVDSLPEEVKLYNYQEEIGTDLPHRIDVAVDLEGIGQVSLFMDTSGLTKEQIHYAVLYKSLLGKLPTSKHSYSEVQKLMNRYLYDGSFYTGSRTVGEQNTFEPYVGASFIALDEDLDEAYSLLYEIMFQTKLNNTKQLKELVSKFKLNVKNTVNSSPHYIALYRQYARANDTYGYYLYANCFDYYEFLCDIEKQLDSDPKAVIKELKAIREYLNNSAGLTIGYVGGENSFDINKAASAKLVDKLDVKEIVPNSFDFDYCDDVEAIVIEEGVSYNTAFATWEEMGLDGFSADWNVISQICSDKYMQPIYRDIYGAYGAVTGVTNDGFVAFTYRDKYVKQTYDLLSDMPDILRNLDIDQETLDGYILAAYSSYAKPAGELSGGSSALGIILGGREQLEVLDYMKEIKNLKIDDLSKYAEAMDKFIANSSRVTAGPTSAIAAEDNYFVKVINPFGAVDKTKVVFSDVIEGSDYYDAIRAMYEEGYMSPVADDVFGAENTATVGDLAEAFCTMLGGSSDPDMVELLVSYGMLPSTDAAATVTRAELLSCCNAFAGAVGINLAVTLLKTDGDATRADVAYACAQFLE